MRKGESDASAYDHMPFRIIMPMPWAATYALLSHARLLSLLFQAIHNVVLQLSIYKKGPPHHVMSHRPIKVGSCCNRTFAGVVHDDIMSRGEALGAWGGGGAFAYRKEMLTQFMALSAMATVLVCLNLHAEVHIADGDESVAFDKPLCADVRLPTPATPGRCDYGGWAHNFYGRMQVRLWSVRGLAPLVTPAIGFSRGCSCATTAYNDLGTFRTRGLQTSRVGWWLAAQVPLMKFVYSDNRRWFGHTAREVAAVASVAHVLSQYACAPSNHSKMEYRHLQLHDDGFVVRKPGIIAVHGNLVSATIDMPVMVGVALEPGSVPPQFHGAFLRRTIPYHTIPLLLSPLVPNLQVCVQGRDARPVPVIWTNRDGEQVMNLGNLHKLLAEEPDLGSQCCAGSASGGIGGCAPKHGARRGATSPPSGPQ